MAEYRLYCLDGAGQIAGVPQVIEAATDEQAVAAVKALELSGPCEVWLGTRLIAQIPATGNS